MFRNVYSAGGYCLKNIFMYVDATYYGCGVYGWNYDAYVDYTTDSVIMWGDRGTFGKMIPYEFLEKWNEKFKAFWDNNSYSDESLEKAENLRAEFFNELLSL